MLFGALLLIYVACGTGPWSRDTLPARFLPLSLLGEGDFDLDEFPSIVLDDPYYLVRADGRLVSYYPVATPVLAVPVYAVLELLRPAGERIPPWWLERIAAASLVALSAVLVHLTARRLAGSRVALLVTAVYALGTPAWSLTSQALWQHTGSQLAFSAALYALVRGRSDRLWLALAGFPLALAVVCRPTNLLLAAPLALHAFAQERRRSWRFLLAAAPPVVFQLAYNWAHFGGPLQDSGYGATSAGMAVIPSVAMALGPFVSPGRGLFVHSPILALGLVGLALAWKRGGDRLLRAVAIGVALTFLAYATFPVWWAGWGFGPRYHADLAPALSLALVALGPRLPSHRPVAALAVALAAMSMAVHAIGATSLWSHVRWHREIDPDGYPRRLWSWRDNQLANPLRELAAAATIRLRELPTSGESGDPVRAAFGTPSPFLLRETPVPGPAQVRIHVSNTGDAAWLARGPAAVELRWSWSTPDGRILARGARQLRFSVLPGGTYEFHVPVLGPRHAGDHVLQVMPAVDDRPASAHARRWKLFVPSSALARGHPRQAIERSRAGSPAAG